MTIDEAAALIADPHIDGTTWADLGCGDGTFTRALATLLPPASVIHAMDRDRDAVSQIPRAYAGNSIVTHVGDFTATPLPFDGLDGVLLANSLHYVRDQSAFIQACTPALRRRRFLVVEYDTDKPNPWVSYPIGQPRLREVFADAGYLTFTVLGSRPSMYRRAEIYAALIED